jgi:hypothetical protein
MILSLSLQSGSFAPELCETGIETSCQPGVLQYPSSRQTRRVKRTHMDQPRANRRDPHQIASSRVPRSGNGQPDVCARSQPTSFSPCARKECGNDSNSRLQIPDEPNLSRYLPFSVRPEMVQKVDDHVQWLFSRLQRRRQTRLSFLHSSERGNRKYKHDEPEAEAISDLVLLSERSARGRA